MYQIGLPCFPAGGIGCWLKLEWNECHVFDRVIKWLKCVGTAADTDTDVIIKPADKGLGTVEMDRQNCLDECYRQLKDSSFYKRVNEDPTEDVNKQVRFYLKRLLTNNIIDKQTFQKIPKLVVSMSCQKSANLSCI